MAYIIYSVIEKSCNKLLMGNTFGERYSITITSIWYKQTKLDS